ncbi:hypothetical protein [Nonomuraea sp. NPDC049784]|uniref:hypothetical protein n=1 Tax=Nonomuraea sp. NPDC049784 TaxID=3154361 RepID=UPI00340259FF
MAGYTDEWRATLEDPEKLRRFVSFVNAPDSPDPSIVFEPERPDQALHVDDHPVTKNARDADYDEI